MIGDRNMIDKMKFPYFNMQQLNLDWLLEYVARCPEMIAAPALSEDNNQSVYDAIDSMDDNTPDGLSFIVCGDAEDTAVRRCCIMVWKMDDNNLYGIILSTSANLRGRKCAKINGNWMMYA